MKESTRWRKTLAAAIALVALAVAAAAAHAGQKLSQPTIVVSGSTGYAYGTLGSARNGGGATSEAIECGVSAYAPPSQSSTSYLCWAQDAAGQYALCLATSESQKKVIQAARGDSAVYFEWDSYGRCTYLSIGNGSAYEPKLP